MIRHTSLLQPARKARPPNSLIILIIVNKIQVNKIITYPKALDANRHPLLLSAIQTKNPEVIKLLIDMGTDRYMKTAEGIPLLLHVLANCEREMIQLLMTGAQCIDWSSKFNETSPLRYLLHNCQFEPQFEILKPFVQEIIAAQIKEIRVVNSLNALCDDPGCWEFLSRDEAFFIDKVVKPLVQLVQSPKKDFTIIDKCSKFMTSVDKDGFLFNDMLQKSITKLY